MKINTAYPFASSKVLSDGKSILFTLNDETIVNAAYTKQAAFKEIMEPFCKKLEFSKTESPGVFIQWVEIKLLKIPIF